MLFALILCFFSFQFLTCKLNLHVNWCENVCFFFLRVFVFFAKSKKNYETTSSENKIDSLNWRSTQTLALIKITYIGNWLVEFVVVRFSRNYLNLAPFGQSSANRFHFLIDKNYYVFDRIKSKSNDHTQQRFYSVGFWSNHIKISCNEQILSFL